MPKIRFRGISTQEIQRHCFCCKNTNDFFLISRSQKWWAPLSCIFLWEQGSWLSWPTILSGEQKVVLERILHVSTVRVKKWRVDLRDLRLRANNTVYYYCYLCRRFLNVWSDAESTIYKFHLDILAKLARFIKSPNKDNKAWIFHNWPKQRAVFRVHLLPSFTRSIKIRGGTERVHIQGCGSKALKTSTFRQTKQSFLSVIMGTRGWKGRGEFGPSPFRTAPATRSVTTATALFPALFPPPGPGLGWPRDLSPAFGAVRPFPPPRGAPARMQRCACASPDGSSRRLVLGGERDLSPAVGRLEELPFHPQRHS